MILLGMEVPLIELTFTGIVIIIVILLEMIIVALLTSRQLGSAVPAATLGRSSVPLPSVASSKSAMKLSLTKTIPSLKTAAPKPISSAPLARSEKQVLEQELARVQEQLSRLPAYAPQRAVVKTELPSTGHSSSPDDRKLERQIQDVDRLLRAIDLRAPHSFEQQEARAYREVQNLAKKVEPVKLPKGELLRLEEELARLRKKLQSGSGTPVKSRRS